MDSVDGCYSRTQNKIGKTMEKSIHSDKERFESTDCDSGFHSASISLSNDSDSGCLKDIREQIASLSVTKEDDEDDLEEDSASPATRTKFETELINNSKLPCSEIELEDEGISVSGDLESCKSCGTNSVVDRITDDSLVIYGKDTDGDTLLHIAIIQEATELALQFIQAAPWYDWLDIYNDKLRQTPLHLATIMGLTRVVRRLVVGGANIEMCDHNGDTALHIACQTGDDMAVAALLNPVESEESRQNEYLTKCQRIPQNLEMRNFDGHTCLHVAAMNGHKHIMQMLLERGAQINAGDCKSGASVLHYAAEKNDISLGQFVLSQRGVSINKTMYSGATPLMVAHGRRHSEMVELLSLNGANCVCLSDSSSSSEDD